MLVLFITFMIILPSFFVGGQEIEGETNTPAEGNDAMQENDWTYYMALPVSLILILILMVAMIIYVRKLE